MHAYKILTFFMCIFLISDQSFVFSVACDPDQSIENQKAKKISPEAQALLVKILQDKISLTWPVPVCQCWVSSLFGQRKSGFHNGVDFAAQQGTPVYAVANGVIESVQVSSDVKGYGNMILLAHDNNEYKTRYAHLHDLFVKQGQSVNQGQQIGTVGATGHVIAKTAKSDPSHLHFEVYRGAKRINPLVALFAADPGWVKSQK